MLRKGLDFHTVRVVCKNCGWYRNIAHSGCADGKRALLNISVSDDPSHVLRGEVIEVSEDSPLEDVLREHPGFQDLVHEAHEMGLIRMEEQFQPLLGSEACPRCEKVGNLKLSQLWNLGAHVRY